jgi:glycerophosphoryl diester phosphodiesterase
VSVDRPGGSHDFTIIAHRGVTDRAPGNTVAAFRAAQALGVDGVELDVRLSRDGVPIVHHNWYVDEGVPQPVPVYSLSAEELRREAVRDDRPEYSRQHPIPTLDEVLQEFAGNLSLEIELKSPEPELSSAIASALEPFRASWPTMELTSFSTSLLADAGQRCPGIRTALLLGRIPAYMRSDVLAYFAVQSAKLANVRVVHMDTSELSASVVATIRAAGLDIHVYPVNDESAVELVRRHGVREVVTDAAAHILDLRRSVGSSPRDRASEGAGFYREGQQTD